jgi:hypothetical protein
MSSDDRASLSTDYWQFPRRFQVHVHSSWVSLQAQAGEYEFTPTQDWCTSNIPSWKSYFPLVTLSEPCILEIESWEGRSVVLLLTTRRAQGGQIVFIDHVDLMQTPAEHEKHRKLTQNLARTSRPSLILAQFGVPALYCKERDSPDDGFPLYRFDVPLPFFALTILRSMSVALVTLVN